MSLTLKEDTEILTKGLKVSLGGSTSADAVELADLAAELQAEAGVATSAEAVAAHWADLGNRRALFDRALVGRLSIAEEPVIEYLVGAFFRCVDLKARTGSRASEALVEVYDYVAELTVSYTAIAMQNPNMFPQPADAEADGVLRLLPPLRSDTMPAGFLSRLVAKLSEEEGALAEVFNPLFAELANEVPPRRPAR